MFEVAEAGNDHAHLILLAVIDAVLVVDGAAGVGHGGDAGLMGSRTASR